MLTYVKGDIFSDPAMALVNPVNCLGVMGKGLALQFRDRFPAMYQDYRRSCRVGLVPGSLHTFAESGILVVNLPTKMHWRDPSELCYVDQGLVALVELLIELDVPSVALPALGCGEGGLSWQKVRPLMDNRLTSCQAEIRVYLPPSTVRGSSATR